MSRFEPCIKYKIGQLIRWMKKESYTSCICRNVLRYVRTRTLVDIDY